MRITSDTHLGEIKKAFQDKFKGLKIEFFNAPHQDSEGSHKKDIIIILEQKAVDLSSKGNESTINWQKEMTVSGLEQMFETDFGLHVQVFRLSGINWLETTTTDNYTLEQQMLKSAETQPH
jgi:hypothetical protein